MLPSLPRLEFTADEPLKRSLHRDTPLVWISPHGWALLGWGERVRIEASGPDRFAQLSRGITANILDGDIAFASGAFADDSRIQSVAIIPEILGLWNNGTLTATAPPPPCSQAQEPEELDTSAGRLTREGFRRAVSAAITAIEDGQVDKVVLARDLVAEGPEPINLSGVLTRLSTANPAAMIYHVDGLFGASPELLVRRTGETVFSRVLAGSAPPNGPKAVHALASSHKDQVEHEYAVRSVVDALATLGDAEVIDAGVLELPTILHLFTDVHATLRAHDEGAHPTALDVAATIHPSAAVCGTPTPDAARLLAELEGFDRGRYAGPVGWMNSDGDGEFAIALRCGMLEDDGRAVRMYAGCGVVAESDPSTELAETSQKFLPIYEALSPVARP